MSRFFFGKLFSPSPATSTAPAERSPSADSSGTTSPYSPDDSTCTRSLSISSCSSASSSSLQVSRPRTSSVNSSRWLKSIFGRRSPASSVRSSSSTARLSPLPTTPPLPVQVELAEDAIDIYELNKTEPSKLDLNSNLKLIRSLPLDCFRTVNGIPLRPTKQAHEFGTLNQQPAQSFQVPLQCGVDSVMDKIGIVLLDKRGISGYRQMSRHLENQLVIVMQGLKSMNTIARSKQPADRLKPFYQSITEMIFGSIALTATSKHNGGGESNGASDENNQNPNGPKKLHRLGSEGLHIGGGIEIFMNSFVFETNFSGRSFRSKFGIACFWLCDNINSSSPENAGSMEQELPGFSDSDSPLSLKIRNLILNCPNVINDCMEEFRNDLVRSKLYSTKCVEEAANKMIFNIDQFINAVRFVPGPLPKSEIVGELANLWQTMQQQQYSPKKNIGDISITANNNQNFLSSLLSTILALSYKQNNLRIVLWASVKPNVSDAQRIEKISQLVRILTLMNHFRSKTWKEDNVEDSNNLKLQLELSNEKSHGVVPMRVVLDTRSPKPELSTSASSKSGLQHSKQHQSQPTLKRTSNFVCNKRCITDTCLHGFEDEMNCHSERSSSSSNSSTQTNQSTYSSSSCNHQPLQHDSEFKSLVSSPIKQQQESDPASDFNYRKSRDESIGYQSLTSSYGNSGRCSPSNCFEAILQDINSDLIDKCVASKCRPFSTANSNRYGNDDIVKTGHFHSCHDCIKRCPRCSSMSNSRFLKSRSFFRGYVNLRQNTSQSPSRALNDYSNENGNYSDEYYDDGDDFLAGTDNNQFDEQLNLSGSNGSRHFFLPSSSVETVVNAVTTKIQQNYPKAIFTVGTPDFVHSSVSSTDILDRLSPINTKQEPTAVPISSTKSEESKVIEETLFASPTIAPQCDSLPVPIEVSIPNIQYQKPSSRATPLPANLFVSPLTKFPGCLEVSLPSDQNSSDSNYNSSGHEQSSFTCSPVIFNAHQSSSSANVLSVVDCPKSPSSYSPLFALPEYPLLTTSYLKYSLSQVVIVETDPTQLVSPFANFISKINDELSSTDDTAIVCNCDQWTISCCERLMKPTTSTTIHSNLVYNICRSTPAIYSQFSGNPKIDQTLWEYFISKFRSICLKSEILCQLLLTDRYKLFRMNERDPSAHDKLVRFCNRLVYELENINSGCFSSGTSNVSSSSLVSFASHLYLYQKLDELLSPNCATNCIQVGFDPSDWPVMIGLRKQIRLDKSKKFDRLIGLQTGINIHDADRFYLPIISRCNTPTITTTTKGFSGNSNNIGFERRFRFNFLFNVDYDLFDIGPKGDKQVSMAETSFIEKPAKSDLAKPNSEQ